MAGTFERTAAVMRDGSEKSCERGNMAKLVLTDFEVLWVQIAEGTPFVHCNEKLNIVILRCVE
jgi:hypothetical protein